MRHDSSVMTAAAKCLRIYNLFSYCDLFLFGLILHICPAIHGCYSFLFAVSAQLSSDAARYHRDMRCTDSSPIPDRNVIADNRSRLCRFNHRCIGHRIDSRWSNVGSPSIVCIDIGECDVWRVCENSICPYKWKIESNWQSQQRKESVESSPKVVFLMANVCVLFAQGVHTMLPISWPVSVVLAVILSVIHLGCRIASSVQDYLFLQTVCTLAAIYTFDIVRHNFVLVYSYLKLNSCAQF